MLQNRLKQIENIFIFSLLALFPVFMLPGLPNPFVTAKLFLLATALVVVFSFKIIRNLTSKTKGVVFNTSTLDLPVFLLALAYGLSGYFVTPNRMEAFWLPGSASFVVGGAILYFVLQQLSERNKFFAKLSLVAGGGLVAISSVLVTSGLFKSFQGLPAYMQSDLFNPTGSLLTVSLLLIILTPFALELLMNGQNMLLKVFSGVTLGLFALAFVASTASLVKNWSAIQFPALNTSWIVATESLKNSPFMGGGPGNYLSSFSMFIPLSYNTTGQWATRFSNASDFYLTLITETGLFGLAAVVVLLLAFYRRIRKIYKETSVYNYLPAVLGVLLLAIFPASPVLVILFFVLLALSGRPHVVHMFVPAHEAAEATTEGKVSIGLIAIPTIALCAFCFYLSFQSFRGEVVYQNALNAISAQDGKKAYDTLRAAIGISPYSDRFHVTYAQLNLLLANAITTNKKDLTADDKNTISQLIQQAISEGRNGVILNAQRSSNWASLGSIYKAVIPLAQGADQFAIQTYSQAVVLDPLNPNTRIALGGVYYGLKRYDEAIDVFRLAVSVKPDLANAHYNLAVAYRDNGQYDKALTELNGALTLVTKDSDDYKALQKEIDNVQSKVPKKDQAPTQTSSLTPPTTIEDKAASQKIALPANATPPTPGATASPEPAATLAPSASPAQ